MKKLFCLALTVFLLLCGTATAISAAAAGTLSASPSAKTVTVGQTVTVTLHYDGNGAPIASIDATVNYNAAAFEYTSYSGPAGVAGGAGNLLISYFAEQASAPNKVSVALTFKAIAAGNLDMSVSTTAFFNDNDGSSLGNPAASAGVTCTNPTLSGNANLGSIKPSTGTLTPAFKAATTQYTVSVPYATTSLNLTATAAEKGAKVSISGSNALAVGKNTRVITVTAPNGTTKKYTVVITRLSSQETDVTTPTSAVPPAGNPLEVSVDGQTMTVADSQQNTALPPQYTWDTVTINDVAVSAAKNNSNHTVLVYLLNANGEGAYYLYDENSHQFAAYRAATVTGGAYILPQMPADITAPAGTVAGECTIGDITVSGWVYSDEQTADYCIVYAIAPNGNTGLYTYDKTDGSFQRYHETETAAPTEPETEPEKSGVRQVISTAIRFVTANRTMILIGAAILGGIILIIIAIVLLCKEVRRSNHCKH